MISNCCDHNKTINKYKNTKRFDVVISQQLNSHLKITHLKDRWRLAKLPKFLIQTKCLTDIRRKYYQISPSCICNSYKIHESYSRWNMEVWLCHCGETTKHQQTQCHVRNMSSQTSKSTAADHSVSCELFVNAVSSGVHDDRLYSAIFAFRLIRTYDILGLIMCKNNMLNN